MSYQKMFNFFCIDMNTRLSKNYYLFYKTSPSHFVIFKFTLQRVNKV